MAAGAASAQVVPDGYYRLQSVKTGRYPAVVDNRGSVDMASTSVDLGAIHSFRTFDENVVSNPGSIIYARYVSDGYDLSAQGASTYDMVGYYIRIRLARGSSDTYWAYGTKAGNTIYIGDVDSYEEEGILVDNDPHHEWRILPVETGGDNYFGLRPACEAGGKYYQPFYASFPFSFASEGMKAYYVTKFGNGMAVMKEYTGETLPASMPMFIECSASEPTDNRFNLLTTSASLPSDNILTGTYFNNDWPSVHRNYVTNDTATIRMLGVTSDGSLGFVAKPEVDRVPANTAYLVVPAGTEKELKLVTEEEYTTGISTVVASEAKSQPKTGVYTITGVKVADGNTLPEGLAAGIYVVGGKKVVVR